MVMDQTTEVMEIDDDPLTHLWFHITPPEAVLPTVELEMVEVEEVVTMDPQMAEETQTQEEMIQINEVINDPCIENTLCHQQIKLGYIHLAYVLPLSTITARCMIDCFVCAENTLPFDLGFPRAQKFIELILAL